MKKKGFATSAILYTMLLLFLVLMTSILNNLQNKKTILDQLKVETINALNQDTIIDAILEQVGLIQTNISELENKITTLEETTEKSPKEYVSLLYTNTKPNAGEKLTLSDNIQNYSKILIRINFGYVTEQVIDVKTQTIVDGTAYFILNYNYTPDYRYFCSGWINGKTFTVSLCGGNYYDFKVLQVYGIR